MQSNVAWCRTFREYIIDNNMLNKDIDLSFSKNMQNLVVQLVGSKKSFYILLHRGMTIGAAYIAILNILHKPQGIVRKSPFTAFILFRILLAEDE